jgi:hypothetical protein
MAFETPVHFILTHRNLLRTHFASAINWLQCNSPSLSATRLIFTPCHSCKTDIPHLTPIPSPPSPARISSSFVLVNLTHLPRSILTHFNWPCHHPYPSLLSTALICHRSHQASHSDILPRPLSPALAYHVTHLPSLSISSLAVSHVGSACPHSHLSSLTTSFTCHPSPHHASNSVTLYRPHSFALAHHVTHLPSPSTPSLAFRHITTPTLIRPRSRHSSCHRSPHLASHSVTSLRPHSLTHPSNLATLATIQCFCRHGVWRAAK